MHFHGILWVREKCSFQGKLSLNKTLRSTKKAIWLTFSVFWGLTKLKKKDKLTFCFLNVRNNSKTKEKSDLTKLNETQKKWYG